MTNDFFNFDAPIIKEQEQMSEMTHKEAIEELEFIEQTYRCSECGEDIIGEHNFCPICGAKLESK